MKDCNQCGKCCVIYADGGLSASQQEIDAWEESRPDIFAFVRDGKIWEQEDQARYVCSIYDDRPNDCRLYPSNIDEMLRDECEMLEPHDLSNTTKAQKTLDELMAESRSFFVRV